MKRLTRKLYVSAILLTFAGALFGVGGLVHGYAPASAGAPSGIRKPAPAAAAQKTQGAISVGIKTQPDKALGVLDLGSKADLPVAILSSPGFKASDVNPSTIRFAGASTMKNRGGGNGAGEPLSDVKRSGDISKFKVEMRDVNGDGLADMVAYFSIPYLSQLHSGWQQARLTGKRFDGASIEGVEAINVTGQAGPAGCAAAKGAPAPNVGGKASSPTATTVSFCNPAPITINDNAAASLYPSDIAVAGQTGVISSLTVTVTGFNHTFAQDVSVLLVGPSGQKMILWAQASDGSAAVNANLVFDDAATAYLPIGAAIVSGTFKPTNRSGNNIFGDVNFPAPAPQSTVASPYSATLSSFKNTDPNGTWSLYVVDNAGGDSGSIDCGWCLDITTAASVTDCPSTLLQGSIAAGDSTQVDRMFRDGAPSECVGAAKTCPDALGGSATLRFDQYTLTNQSAADACVTVTTTSGCGTNVFTTAFLTSYAPPPPGTNLCVGYLGDPGLSPSSSGIGPAFSFTLPAGATVVLVVNEVSATGCGSYSLLVEGDICAPAGAVCTLTCPATVTQSNDPNQCGALVTYPAPTTSGTCGTVTCAPTSGTFFPVGVTTVTCTDNGIIIPRPSGVAGAAACSFTVTVQDTQAPSITCPANITQSNDTNQCGAVVNYAAPTVSDNCPGVGAPVCVPASGSFFPVGATTVTCTVADASPDSADGACTFTVTVNDTQPPSITCPTNVTTVTDQNVCPAPACQTVTYPDPTVTDNCPGATFVCSPPSGGCFATGVTTVTCTATDTAGNTATCSFTVSVFDTALQDDSNPAIILLWNSITGAYRFCCNGITFTGVGKATRQGCVYTLDHTFAFDRRVLGKVDKAVHAGSGSLQAPPGTIRCTITDRNTLNDTLMPACQ